MGKGGRRSDEGGEETHEKPGRDAPLIPFVAPSLRRFSSSPLKKCFDGESHDQIRQIKEPDRRHIPDTSRFGDAELADLGRS